MRWNYVTRGIMIFLIMLSLFLTWLIWTRTGQYGDQTNTNRGSTSGIMISRQTSRVFGPHQVILHEDGEMQLTTSQEIMSRLSKEIAGWKIDDFETPIEMTNSDYQERMAQLNVVEFVFPEKIPFGIFGDNFNTLAGEFQNSTFDRSYVSVADPTHIYFYNTELELFYDGTLEEVDSANLTAILSHEEAEYYSITSVLNEDKLVYTTDEEISLPYLSYMVERQPNQFFIERLFDDTSEVRETSDDMDHIMSYNDYVSMLQVNEETSILRYEKNRAAGNNQPMTETLRDSYNELIIYENWLYDVHYFDYNTATKEVTFRRFIEGFPVFGDNDYGTTEIRVAENGLSSLQVPLVIAQTPISDIENQKTLLSGESMLAMLSKVGYEVDKIEKLVIGYTWTNSSESDRVINLEPNWYIYADGTWQNAQALYTNEGGLMDGF